MISRSFLLMILSLPRFINAGPEHRGLQRFSEPTNRMIFESGSRLYCCLRVSFGCDEILNSSKGSTNSMLRPNAFHTRSGWFPTQQTLSMLPGIKAGAVSRASMASYPLHDGESRKGFQRYV
jgi:hypothetical protein